MLKVTIAGKSRNTPLAALATVINNLKLCGVAHIEINK
jgi:hypothetical protein